ncbi:hypothetical protein [Novosphingobium album (ex Hu et al. 2023)]|uniref:Uncharacterized protein n=1 Tax=Novosphingobium album (ex Hu et al. 2023) TaxID=2930093 RepID=A0ABT0B7G8_9SPHN|nr:hypothetical protein [Novosphingobium album (ex Hu et al. 2023)]MCJ2181015.1 hypothetical protein [Novosphingobium album (ex Hu et al. 2023)]
MTRDAMRIDAENLTLVFKFLDHFSLSRCGPLLLAWVLAYYRQRHRKNHAARPEAERVWIETLDIQTPLNAKTRSARPYDKQGTLLASAGKHTSSPHQAVPGAEQIVWFSTN